MKKIVEKLNTFLIAYDENITHSFEIFYNELIACNQEFNITAIVDKEEVIQKHFIDSIMALPLLKDKNIKTVLDIGAGAGFPSLPLARVLPGITFTLVESIKKKVGFIEHMCAILGLQNASVKKTRAEELPKDIKYDACVARGVAGLPTLCEYCLPYLRTGGILIAYKGPQCQEEIQSAQNALKILGGEVEEIKPYTLTVKSELYNRALVVIKKVKDSPPVYPRGGNKPRLKPL